MEPVVALALVAVVAGALGIVIGMLVAPRLARWAERDDTEEPQG